jgi:hypothetical protein
MSNETTTERAMTIASTVGWCALAIIIVLAIANVCLNMANANAGYCSSVTPPVNEVECVTVDTTYMAVNVWDGNVTKMPTCRCDLANGRSIFYGPEERDIRRTWYGWRPR